jgi:hypothetical protein
MDKTQSDLGWDEARKRANGVEVVLRGPDDGQFWGFGHDNGEDIPAYGFGETVEEATRDVRRVLTAHFYAADHNKPEP